MRAESEVVALVFVRRFVASSLRSFVVPSSSLRRPFVVPSSSLRRPFVVPSSIRSFVPSSLRPFVSSFLRSRLFRSRLRCPWLVSSRLARPIIGSPNNWVVVSSVAPEHLNHLSFFSVDSCCGLVTLTTHCSRLIVLKWGTSKNRRQPNAQECLARRLQRAQSGCQLKRLAAELCCTDSSNSRQSEPCRKWWSIFETCSHPKFAAFDYSLAMVGRRWGTGQGRSVVLLSAGRLMCRLCCSAPYVRCYWRAWRGVCGVLYSL